MKKHSKLRTGAFVSLPLALLLAAWVAWPASTTAALIPTNSVWKYLDDASDQGSAWSAPAFDDSAWASGPGQLGFGDGDEATVLRPGAITYYFRRGFDLANPSVIFGLNVRLLRDDGGIVYLNGVEVFRSNIPAGPATYTTLASAAVGGEEERSVYFSANVDPTLLVAGANVIAVEIHQVSLTSSDVSFDLELSGNPVFTNDLPTVTLTAVDDTASEIAPWLDQAPDPGVFRFSRTGPANDALAVSFGISGTASNRIDYSPLPNQITIPAGVSAVELSVNVLDDIDAEGTETVRLSLGPSPCIDWLGPGCYRVGTPSIATVSILDNEATNPPPTNVTLVATGSVWKYLDNGSDQGTAWRQPGFDDTPWASGPAQLGYGDGDEATVVSSGPDPLIKYITTYFRRAFELADASAVGNLTLRVLRDDGAVVYLNGLEVYRSNMPDGPISFNTLASSVAVDENAYLTVSIPASALVNGRNVVAAEVHQVNPTSSDLGFDLELLGEGGPRPPDLPVVNVIATDPNASEASLIAVVNSGTFTFYRTGDLNTALAVSFTLSGSASNGVDYLPITNRVSFGPGTAEVRLNVNPRYDVLEEGTETVVLRLQPPVCAEVFPPPPGCYRVGPSNEAVVFIADFPPPPPNRPPNVTFVTPREGDVFVSGSSIRLGVNVTDDGQVVSVEFFANGSKIGDAEGPFVTPLGAWLLLWSNVPPGEYSLTGRATDNMGAMGVSAPVHIRVTPDGTGTNSVTLVSTGSVWKYLDTGIDAGTVWREAPYNDSSWASGPAQLGYGDGDEATVVSFGPDATSKYITTYFRRSFEVTDATSITRLTGQLLQDDGGIVFLNGVEVFRSNLPFGPIPFNTLAIVAAENQWVEFQVSPSLLVNGANVIAVEMHQNNPASSDLSFDLSLVGETRSTPTNQAPIVRFVSPTNHQIFIGPTDIALRAQASDADGQVVRVEFFEFTNLLGVAQANGSGQFTFIWSNIAPRGAYFLRAFATDDADNVGISDPVTVGVVPDLGPLPVISVTATDPIASESGSNTATFAIRRAPVTNINLLIGYQLTGTARNGEDYVRLSGQISFGPNEDTAEVLIEPIDDLLFEGSESVVLTVLPVVPPPEPTIPSFPPPRPTYTVNPTNATAIATIEDNDRENMPPHVTIITPQDGEVFDAHANILLGANAPDDSGPVPRLEFFRGNTLIGRAIGPLTTPAGAWLLTWSNAPSGEHTLRAIATDALGARGTSAPVHITVRGEPPGLRELHAIGLYSGLAPGGSSSRNHEQGQAAVAVNRPGKRITLFLSSYEPVLWHVSAGADTVIDRVILAGYYRQVVEGIGPDAEVINAFYDEGQGTSAYLYIGTSVDSVQFQRTLAKLCALTGLDMSSFQGTYTAPYPTPFSIDAVQNDERLRCDYPQPVDLATLPNLGFQVSFFNRSGSGNVYTRNFTLAGPEDGGRLLPGMRVMADAGGRFYYGSEQHEAWRIDSQNGSVEGMNLALNAPELSWPTGAAFDSRRNRVLIGSLGGEGHIYAYSPASNQWSLVAGLGNRDLNGFGYHPPSDSTYGVGSTYDDYHPRVLYRYNSVGELQGQIQLPRMPFNFDLSGYETELVSVGEYLVLLLEPTYLWYYENGQLRESRIYLIDPRTGEVWLTYRRPEAPDADRDGVPDNLDQCPDTPLYTLVDTYGCSVNQRDHDNDGVPDERDRCPNTEFGEAVNAEGCSIAQLCPCDGAWSNHTEYVRCVIQRAWQFHRAGLVSVEQRRGIIHDAVMSDCGRRPGVLEPVCAHALPLTTEECQRDGFQLILTGDADCASVLECSTDLTRWTPIQTNSVTITGYELVDRARITESTGRFYRIRLLEIP